MRFKQIIENSTTAGSVATVAQPMMTQARESVDVRGLKPVQQVMKDKSKKKGPYANSIVESKVNEDDLAEQDLIVIPGQGRLKRTGFVKHDLDQGEHEGHTLKNSLHTIIRVATDLDKRLSVQSEFPEWVSEKIGATKSMMVTVMDYLISSQEMQHDRDAMAESHEDDEECSSCDGTGEGRHEGQSCGACGGSGVARGHYDDDDFDIPDDDDMYEGVAEGLDDTASATPAKNERGRFTAWDDDEPIRLKCEDGEFRTIQEINMLRQKIGMKPFSIKSQQGVAEGSEGNWYIRVNGKILNDTKFKPMIFSSEDEARSYAMKLADKKRIPLSQIKLTKSWMDAPEQGVAEANDYFRRREREEGRIAGTIPAKKAVVKTNKPIGFRISDIGPGGKEHNVKTDAAWDAAKKKVSEGSMK